LKLEKSASLIVVESLDVPPEHTQLHLLRCLDTPERFVWIRFLVFLKFRAAKIQSGAGIAWLQGRSWLANMSRATNLC